MAGNAAFVGRSVRTALRNALVLRLDTAVVMLTFTAPYAAASTAMFKARKQLQAAANLSNVSLVA
jgi:hypothetical protein